VPGKIQIINEGTLKNGGQFGYVENFGAIINRGGELLNDGEIVPFTNSTIINTGGGRIEIGAHGILGIANMTNENIGSVVENYGNFYNSGTIHNIDGAIITNDGFGKMTNQGYIYNQSIISNAGVGEITNDWKIYNGCEAVIEGEIKENLPIENCDQKL
jgi:hypothetical protein